MQHVKLSRLYQIVSRGRPTKCLASNLLCSREYENVLYPLIISGYFQKGLRGIINFVLIWSTRRKDLVRME